jgi:hypothetical protein
MLKVLLPAVEIITLSEPEVSFEEVHAAEHVVALIEDQLKVDVLSNSTDIGFAERLTVGADGGVVGAGVSPPPPPQEVIKIIETTLTNSLLKFLFILLKNSSPCIRFNNLT